MPNQIVTGNGFDNNAQRYDSLSGSLFYNDQYYLSASTTYDLSFKCRNSSIFSFDTYNTPPYYNTPNPYSLIYPNTSNAVTKNYTFNYKEGYLGFTNIDSFYTSSTTTNPVPTSHPSGLTFILDTSLFPLNYVINSGMTCYISSTGNYFLGIITSYDPITGSLSLNSYWNSGSGTFSNWSVSIYLYSNLSTDYITIPSSYPTPLTFTIGENLYYKENMSVFLNINGVGYIYGYVTSYDSISGSLSMISTLSWGSGTYNNFGITTNYGLFTKSTSTILLPSITGVTITGYTCIGIPSGITDYMINTGNNSSYVYMTTTSGRDIYGYLTSYNSITGYFTILVYSFSGGGSSSSWTLQFDYMGYYIEIDEINLTAV